MSVDIFNLTYTEPSYETLHFKLIHIKNDSAIFSNSITDLLFGKSLSKETLALDADFTTDVMGDPKTSPKYIIDSAVTVYTYKPKSLVKTLA